jgi:hypothetical protein
MAKSASFFDLAMVTADDAVETHGGHAGRQKPPSHVYRYLASTAEPITWYRQLIGVRWEWTQSPSPDAVNVNPYSLRTLARRAALDRDVPTGSVIEFAEERHVQAARPVL